MDIRDHGFNPTYIEVMDSSRLKDFIDCPSMFYLRHILGLKMKYHDPSVESKFDWGTCWHSVLEEYHRAGQSIPAALQKLEEEFPAYINPTTDRYKRSKERMIKSFFDYVEKWGKADEGMEIIRYEQFFDLYSEDDDLRWCGRIDSIRRRKNTGNIVVVDYKTSSAMGDTYFDSHEMGFQFPGYVWAVNQMMGDVKEIMVDVNYMVTRKNDFFRKTFRYDSARLNEWVREVKLWLDRVYRLMDNHLYDPNQWAKNYNECYRYGRCQFANVHAISPKGSARLNILKQDYMEDRWEPNFDEQED